MRAWVVAFIDKVESAELTSGINHLDLELVDPFEDVRVRQLANDSR